MVFLLSRNSVFSVALRFFSCFLCGINLEEKEKKRSSSKTLLTTTSKMPKKGATKATKTPGVRMSKDDRIAILMWEKACILEGKPVTEPNLYEREWQDKKKTNTCALCHDFKSTATVPQAALNPKERLELAHKCKPPCKGFTTCKWVKVCASKSTFSLSCVII